MQDEASAISAHRSTPSQRLPPVSIVRSSQIRGPVGQLPAGAGMDHFRSAQLDQYSGGGYPARRSGLIRARRGQG
jgi:hypothetical protein